MRMFACAFVINQLSKTHIEHIKLLAHQINQIDEKKKQKTKQITNIPNQKTNAKGGVAAWPDVQKTGATLGNLTPADRHGSVQVCPFVYVRAFFCVHIFMIFRI